jgi:hypothetical protein
MAYAKLHNGLICSKRNAAIPLSKLASDYVYVIVEAASMSPATVLHVKRFASHQLIFSVYYVKYLRPGILHLTQRRPL